MTSSPLTAAVSTHATLPVITLGGTSAASLCDDQVGVVAALGDARAALIAAGPNGRDYIGDDARWTQACAEHRAELRAFDAMMARHDAILAHCADARDAWDARAARRAV